MDSVSSNAYFNPARLYQQNTLQRPVQQSEPQPAAAAQKPVAVEANAPQGNEFTSMFGDNELMKLQGNLEAIAKMAEHALKRFEG